MEEHSKFVTFTYIGGTFGTMITYPICGVILTSLGWEVTTIRIAPRRPENTWSRIKLICFYFKILKAVFYISGGLGIFWLIIWQLCISDDPSTQKLIGEDEKEYILRHRKQTISGIGKKAPPYLKILLTPSVWALMICDFARSFGSYMVIIEGPNFIDKVLKKDILEVRFNRVFFQNPYFPEDR